MIALLVPTRGRPQNVVRLTESLLSTVSDQSNVSVFWQVDEDDGPTALALNSIDHGSLGGWIVDVGPREIPCRRWNYAWRQASTNAEVSIFGLLGDDIVMQTPGWDAMVEETFARVPDRIALVYGRDGFRDEQHASHPFLSREWCDALGRATPEHFSQDMNDVWLFEIAKAVDRAIYLPELFTQHLHPDNPALGVVADATYQDNWMRRDRDQVGALYEHLADERRADVEKLRAAINV